MVIAFNYIQFKNSIKNSFYKMSEFSDFGDDSYYSSSYSETIPDIEYSLLEDDSQMFHRDQLNEKSDEEVLEPPPIPVYDDNSTAFCTSIDQSRKFIHQNFGLSPSTLRTSSLVGLVILSIKDYNLIRKDHRNNRTFPHILVVPNGDKFSIVHQDFKQCIEILNQ